MAYYGSGHNVEAPEQVDQADLDGGTQRLCIFRDMHLRAFLAFEQFLWIR